MVKEAADKGKEAIAAAAESPAGNGVEGSQWQGHAQSDAHPMTLAPPKGRDRAQVHEHLWGILMRVQRESTLAVQGLTWMPRNRRKGHFP